MDGWIWRLGWVLFGFMEFRYGLASLDDFHGIVSIQDNVKYFILFRILCNDLPGRSRTESFGLKHPETDRGALIEKRPIYTFISIPN